MYSFPYFALLGGLLAAATALSLFAAGGLFTLAQVVFRKPVSTDFARTTCIENGEITPEFLARARRDFIVRSRHGYGIHCVEIESDPWTGGGERPVAVFCHGLSWTWHGQVKYMDEYLSRGWRIIAFDHRAHGESGGRTCTYGFYEKDDLGSVIDAVAPEKNARVVLCGESMGGATILQYRPDDERIAARVCDCAFSDLRLVLLEHLRSSGVPDQVARALLAAGSFFSAIILGFPFSAVAPRRSAERMTSPVCLLHGGRDETAPVSMARELFDALRASPAAAACELHIFDEAAHAKSVRTDPVCYSAAVRSFLDRTVSG